ncbi:DUF411 domain-containing protein [Rhodanobacter denitrificans]|uniref:DUF411 domain-containing protein n=1 Tax=Rhodanobacter denitrificans TaxID=666685 RepID=UPI0009D9AFA6|nr:DUF411 domain-containing protein [Rhodanobacter denitrificans]UJM92003.1 DUF411 domain-containing protein [Rhodanobacter denitrificans]
MKRWLSRMGITLLFAALFAPAVMAANALDVYSDPSCGCCGAWVHYMRAQGYTVAVHQDQPMAAVKARFSVPAAAMSCHTALIDGYVIEGHVPVEDIRRLLAERPDARGLAAPGMPAGSPGMELPDGRVQPYVVELIAHDGTTSAFAHHAY